MQPHYSQGAGAHCKPRETPSRTRQALGLPAHGPTSPPVSTRRGPGHPGQPVGPGVRETFRAGLAHPACLWPQGTIPLISASPGCSFGCCFHLLVVFFFCVCVCPVALHMHWEAGLLFCLWAFSRMLSWMKSWWAAGSDRPCTFWGQAASFSRTLGLRNRHKFSQTIF